MYCPPPRTDDGDVTEALFILCVVVATALAFDFTNGFHDTANAMATSIATGALKPKTAVTLSAILNLVGAFLSIEVALTVSNKVIAIQSTSGAPEAGLMGVPVLVIIFAGLVGGIVWNLITWLFGLPSSSSHALFGGLIGAAIAALGVGGVKWDGVIKSIVMPGSAGVRSARHRSFPSLTAPMTLRRPWVSSLWR